MSLTANTSFILPEVCSQFSNIVFLHKHSNTCSPAAYFKFCTQVCAPQKYAKNSQIYLTPASMQAISNICADCKTYSNFENFAAHLSENCKLFKLLGSFWCEGFSLKLHLSCCTNSSKLFMR